MNPGAMPQAAMGCVKSDVSPGLLLLVDHMSVPPSLRGGERRGLGQRPKALLLSKFEIRVVSERLLFLAAVHQ